MIRDMIGQEINIGDYIAHPYTINKHVSKISLQIGLVKNIIDRILVVSLARYLVVPRTRKYAVPVYDWRPMHKRSVRIPVYADYSDRVIKIEVPERIKEMFEEIAADTKRIGIIYKRYSEVSKE